MANFELYLPTLLKHEGGFVNHPNDPGGITNKGITFVVFKKYAKSLLSIEPTIENLKGITNQQVNKIYKFLYWDKIKGDDIKSQSVAEILFDWAVNSGSDLAIKKVQKLLNLTQDGIIGNKTITEINNQNSLILFNDIKSLRKRFYSDIILNNPKLEVFKKGWDNRIESFKFIS